MCGEQFSLYDEGTRVKEEKNELLKSMKEGESDNTIEMNLP
jgi:hypothetical protein